MSAMDNAGALFVASHRGMVGSANVRRLQALGRGPILTATHADLDLTGQARVRQFSSDHRIAHVVLATAKVGGIHANNTYPADFIYENLMMVCDVVHAAHTAGVQLRAFLKTRGHHAARRATG